MEARPHIFYRGYFYGFDPIFTPKKISPNKKMDEKTSKSTNKKITHTHKKLKQENLEGNNENEKSKNIKLHTSHSKKKMVQARKQKKN